MRLVPTRLTLFAGLLASLFFLAGCQSSPHDANAMQGPGVLPTDFSLQFHVVGRDESRQATEQTSQYILDPARQLRIATGAGAREDYFPGVTRVISAEQYEQLIRFIESSHLLAEPTSPNAQAASTQPSENAIYYQVWIRADGQTHRYMTTPQESPPTTQLLQLLNDLRGSTTTAQTATAGKDENQAQKKGKNAKSSGMIPGLP